ncbi:MAG: hypothetical protein D6785_05315, partial [Planctomycetota bacterium]
PTFFIFIPKLPLPPKERRRITVVYKDGFSQYFDVFIKEGKKKPSLEEQVKEKYMNMGYEERRRKGSEEIKTLLREADKLWETRKIPPNEGDYQRAIEKYQKALYIIDTYKPDFFDDNWNQERDIIKHKLENAIKEKEELLEKLRNDFYNYYSEGNRKKVQERLDQLLRLLSNEKNSPEYLRYELYKKYLYK